jgi:carbamoyltransferase
MSADLRDGQFYDGCRKASERGFLNIISISAGYHDSACCLMRRGRIVAAAREERFSRIKNDKAFPAAAFRYCFDQAGLTIADIECVAFYEDACLKLSRQIWMGMLPGLTQQRRAAILSRTLWTRPEIGIRHRL